MLYFTILASLNVRYKMKMRKPMASEAMTMTEMAKAKSGNSSDVSGTHPGSYFIRFEGSVF